MSDKIVTNSPNISVLRTKIVADLSTNYFRIDIANSTFVGTNVSNLLGVKIQVTNPFGTIVKAIGSGFDILPTFSSFFTMPIPTIDGDVQYGVYKFKTILYDAGGITHEIEDIYDVCSFGRKQKKNCVTANLTTDCKNNKVYVLASNPPLYKGKTHESQSVNLVLNYPTGTGISPLVSTNGNFSVPLYQGIYNLKGTVIANYNLDNGLYAIVPFKVSVEKAIKCFVNKCCVADYIKSQTILTKDCNDSVSGNAHNNIASAISLINRIDLMLFCGQDATELITELEDLTKCAIGCGCGDEVISNSPLLSNDILITGCGFSVSTTGNTTTYNFDNQYYELEVDDNGGVFTVSPPILNGCTKKQVATFNVNILYAQIKALIDSSSDYTFWSNIIKKGYSPNANTLSCLGITQAQYNAMGYWAFMQFVFDKICSCCAATNGCKFTITGIETEKIGDKVKISFSSVDFVANEFIDIFIDGVFVASIFGNIAEYILSGYNDGVPHTITALSRCANGSISSKERHTFNYIGCPVIMQPSLSSNSVVNATCPFNLNTLLPLPPIGFVYEWHNANNTLNTTLVGNPTSATSGTYFVFLKSDADSCYSLGSQVIISCAVSGNCTEAINIGVEAVVGGNLVQFDNAIVPPPLNSYLVKRKLVGGSTVTTLGAATFNSSTNKFEYLDTTAIVNTLYEYIIESQCQDGSKPTRSSNFANISCPAIIETDITFNSLNYIFNHVGGDVDKYEIELYDFTGTTLLQTHVYNPTFPSSIVNEFTSLNSSTGYRIRRNVFIGTYKKTCTDIVYFTQDAPSGTLNIEVVNAQDGDVFSLSQTGATFTPNSVSPVPGTGVVNAAGTWTAISTTNNLVVNVARITGTVTIYRNNVSIQTEVISGMQVVFTLISQFVSGDNFKIVINNP